MARLLAISELDAFAKTRSIPESAISAEILTEVRKLREEEQIEVWIQELIGSHDKTPHGPTEIADIISTRVTVLGRHKYSAFILKGRGTPKVSSKKIGHQILKLNQLPGLSLAVLIATGDIQDDAYRDFIATAEGIGCDYLVVSRLDLARLLIAYNKICPHDGLPITDGSCPNGHHAEGEIELSQEEKESEKWELLKLRDLSHGLAKRLSATILIERNSSQNSIRTAIAEIFKEVRVDPYVRNEMVRTRWGNTPAHVVWIDVAHDVEDVNRSNWVCMACWIDPNLDERFRPVWKNYDETYEGIMIDWNSDYQEMKELWAQHTGRKHEVIECVEGIFGRVKPILAPIDQAFTAFRQGAVTEQSLQKLVQSNWEDIDNLYREAGNCPLAPPECVDYSQQFQNVMAFLHNLFLLYTSEVFLNERTPENRAWLFNRNLIDLKDALQKLDYEREKLL